MATEKLNSDRKISAKNSFSVKTPFKSTPCLEYKRSSIPTKTSHTTMCVLLWEVPVESKNQKLWRDSEGPTVPSFNATLQTSSEVHSYTWRIKRQNTLFWTDFLRSCDVTCVALNDQAFDLSGVWNTMMVGILTLGEEGLKKPCKQRNYASTSFNYSQCTYWTLSLCLPRVSRGPWKYLGSQFDIGSPPTSTSLQASLAKKEACQVRRTTTPSSYQIDRSFICNTNIQRPQTKGPSYPWN